MAFAQPRRSRLENQSSDILRLFDGFFLSCLVKAISERLKRLIAALASFQLMMGRTPSTNVFALLYSDGAIASSRLGCLARRDRRARLAGQAGDGGRA